MLKIFIKHCIYEVCIQQLFNALSNNFSLNSKLHNMKVGDTFYSIRIRTSPEKETIYFSPVVVIAEHDYFVIEGVMFTDQTFHNGVYEQFDGDHYRVGVSPETMVTHIGERT